MLPPSTASGTLANSICKEFQNGDSIIDCADVRLDVQSLIESKPVVPCSCIYGDISWIHSSDSLFPDKAKLSRLLYSTS
eukprot:6637507-Ditylum_brightwellii.AAC.1